MAAFSAFTVYDGLATPLAHIFTPEEIKTLSATSQVARWKELNAALPEYALNRCILQKDILKSGVNRMAIQFTIPYMESISGQNSAGYTAPPKVAYFDQIDVIVHANPRSVLAGRLNNQMFVANFLRNVNTTIPAVGTGFAYDLLSAEVMPN